MTVKELSDGSGVAEKTIYRIETGEVADPKLSSIRPLIRALHCSADELLFDQLNIPALASLRRDFAVAAKLKEDDLRLFRELTRRFLLGTTLEQDFKEMYHIDGELQPTISEEDVDQTDYSQP